MKSVSFQNIHVCRLRSALEQAERGLSLGYISSGGSKIFERAPPREMQAIGCFSSGKKGRERRFENTEGISTALRY